MTGWRWEKQSLGGDAPSARSSHAAAVLEGVLVIGGGHGDGMDRGDVVHVNLESGQATTVAPVGKGHMLRRTGHQMCSLPEIGSVYGFGGWDGTQYLDRGFLYAPAEMRAIIECQDKRELPPKRRDHSLVLIDNAMFLFGGWNCVDQFNDVWSLSDTWEWKQIECVGDIPIPRRGHAAAAIGHKLYIFGGMYGFSRYLDDLYVLDTVMYTWKRPETTGDAPSARSWASATAIGNHIIFIGGTSGRLSFYDDVYVLDTETMHWSRPTISTPVGMLPPIPRCSHSATAHGSNIVLFGGLTCMTGSTEKNVFSLNDMYTLHTPF